MKDKIGAYTFNNTPIIDYSILSAESLDCFADFEIREMDALYSDGHSLSVTTLKFRNVVKEKTPISVRKPKHQAKWQANKTDQFISNLDGFEIYEIQSNLEQAFDAIPNINMEDINEFGSWTGSIILESKSKSCDNKTCVPKDSKLRRWFGAQCQTACRKYHSAQKKKPAQSVWNK